MTRCVDGGATYEMVLDANCDASPAAVYDVLADLSTHGGSGPASGSTPRCGCSRCGQRDRLEIGTEFTSVGSTPMARARWENTNVVVEAERPKVPSSSTRKPWRCGGAASGRSGAVRARYRHIRARRDGDLASCTGCARRRSTQRLPLRVRAPLMRTMTHLVILPRSRRRGLKNLLRSAGRSLTNEVARTPKPARHQHRGTWATVVAFHDADVIHGGQASVSARPRPSNPDARPTAAGCSDRDGRSAGSSPGASWSASAARASGAGDP